MTIAYLMESMNDWTSAVQDKHAVTIAHIDFSRAFDSVSHDKLFARLYEYGIRGQLLGWLKTFLITAHTKPELVLHCQVLPCLLSGVVQGSGIGPVMFIDNGVVLYMAVISVCYKM